MSRPLRIEYPGAYYHVMNRGLAYQVVFSDRSDREQFLNLLSECHEMWGIRVLAYCLLNNHYHLLIQTPQANLSRAMRHLDGHYTQRYNRRHKRDGPLFRGRYKAIVVDAEMYLLAVARYIHHDPVAAGRVKSPEAYEWSSCRIYLNERGRPEWLDADQLLSWFPGKNRLKSFRAFMRSKIEEPVEAFYSAKRGLPVLGAESFVEKIRAKVRIKSGDLREVSEAKTYLKHDYKTCLKIVRRVYGVGEEDLLRGQRGKRNEARAMAMVVCRRLAGMKHDDIAKVFGVAGYSAVSSAIGRLQAEIERGREAAGRFEQIRTLLQR
ncbi:MAG: transposase [Nitrospirae bacterium]|nr:transposase [Nitrospirota bacterium]